MWKRIVFAILAVLLVTGIFITWRFFASNTPFKEEARYLYIRTNEATPAAVLDSIKKDTLVRNLGAFEFLAARMDLWQHLQPGRYAIKKGMSLFDIAKLLRSGRQAPIDFTIAKIRTLEGLSEMVGRKFECDSLDFIRFIKSPDSLKPYGLDTNTVLTAIFPDTYTYFWNASPKGIFQKWWEHQQKIWTPQRRQEAEDHGITPIQAYILASIVEEETNYQPEKGNIASVYLNRFKKGDLLRADPTVKYALRNFALTRIYYKHLVAESPYNTYRYKGLPPGPICTPSLKTLDAVLQSPQTKYYFFVADFDHPGQHVFTSTYKEHLKYAAQYHKKQDSLGNTGGKKAKDM